MGMQRSEMSSNISQRLRDEIENEILTGQRTPGERLDEVALANRFGVSRTPIREALLQLSAAGLIEVRPRRGAIVASVGAERLLEMFEVMAELEGLAGRLAARRHTDADMKAIMEAHAACRKAAAAGDSDAYYYENEHFHYAIYHASHSTFLIEQCTALHRRLKPYRRLQLRVRNRVAKSFAEHEAFVAALMAGDADQASDALRSHVAIQGERFSDFIASLAQARSHTSHAASTERRT
jgi:DNA-binding GntR family transcriptional regulator